MEWYGKEHLNPARTKILVKKWQAPPGNVHDSYYNLFPEVYPIHLPKDHYIVNYNENFYPRDRDYRTFKSAPKPIRSSHTVEYEDGYGPCNVCNLCLEAKMQNDEQMKDYYRRLREWNQKGTPM